MARRTLLCPVVVAALALFVAACGDDDGGAGSATTQAASSAPGPSASPVSPAATTAPATATRDGSVRLAWSLDNLTFDPAMNPNPTLQWISLLAMGTLMRVDEDGQFVPDLAESASVVDSRTIDVVLREGLTYQDGAPFNAESVKAGVLRNFAAPGAPGAFNTREYLNFDNIEVTGELSFTIHLKDDVVGSFFPLLSRAEFATISPQSYSDGVYPNEDLVGAGPYKFVSYEPGASVKFTRWDGYWDAASVQVKDVEIKHLTAASLAQAFLADDVDFAVNVPYAVGTQLESAGGDFTVEFGSDPELTGTMYINCKQFPGWSDQRVREAVNLAIDREQISNVLYRGAASPLDTFVAQDHRLFSDDLLGHNNRDVARAKQLLSEAGYADGIQLATVLSPGDTAGMAVAEIIQANLKEVGVDLAIETSSNMVAEVWQEQSRESQVSNAVAWPGINRLTVNYTGFGNTCDVGEPAPDGTPPSADELRMIELVAELRGSDPAFDSQESIDLWHEAERLVSDNTWQIWTVSPPFVQAYSDKVTNPAYILTTVQYAPDVPRIEVSGE